MARGPLRTTLPPGEVARIAGLLTAHSHEDDGCRLHPTTQVRTDGRYIASGRAAWIVRFGPIRQGAFVTTACGRPTCIRHLELATPPQLRERARRARRGAGDAR
jgi:hypothetical protein